MVIVIVTKNIKDLSMWQTTLSCVLTCWCEHTHINTWTHKYV